MLENKTIQIEDAEVTAKIMPIFIALKLKTKLAKEVAPIALALMNGGKDIKESAEVLAEHLKAETVEGIIEVMRAYVDFDGHKLNPEVDFARRGTMFVWQVIWHFLSTNYADVLNSPKLQSLLGRMTSASNSQMTA